MILLDILDIHMCGSKNYCKNSHWKLHKTFDETLSWQCMALNSEVEYFSLEDGSG